MARKKRTEVVILLSGDSKKYADCYVALASHKDRRVVASTRKIRSQKAFSKMCDRAKKKSEDFVVLYVPRFNENFLFKKAG